MFILEMMEGKKRTVVSTADTREQAVEKQALAQENGVYLTIIELVEYESLFKERDYDAEFIALVQQFKEVTEKISRFPLNKLKMSAENYQDEVGPIIRFDMDDFLLTLAKPHQIYVDIGDYGYGRSIEWSTSNGVTTGEWVSSSSTC